MTDQILEINVGPLSSFNSLNLYIGPKLDRLRGDYLLGKRTIPVWDLRNISPKSVSMSALVAFLSLSKKIRDFIGQPIPVMSTWNPEFQGFLSDIGFMEIATKLDLYEWQGMVGGYKRGGTNPQTRIFYYSDIPGKFKSQEELVLWKDSKRQEIKHSMMLRLSNIFDSKLLNNQWSENLEGVLTITGAELIVNSLLHGQDIAFVGVQRSSKRISTAICDTGGGFPRSMRENHTSYKQKELLSHTDALLIASLLSKNKIGLFRAIDDVIHTGGYVIMSSFNSEIRWEEKQWEVAKSLLEKNGLEKINIKDLGKPVEGFVETSRIYEGYYRTNPFFLVGTRITFEIPLL